jgi:uncharacterized cupin superfamily protein
MARSPITHMDDVRENVIDHGHLAHRRRRLGAATGAAAIGCSLYVVEPGRQQMPVHVHGDEEEICFVLAGGGLSWQDGAVCEVAAGDTVVHRASKESHTFLAGPDGLQVLAFASGSETGLTYLARAGVMWAGPRWVPLDSPHPFEAEAAQGPLDLPDPTPRPANVNALADVEPNVRPTAEVRKLGAAGDSRKAGLNHITVAPGTSASAAHCHALEEELIVVLEGSGTLRLGEGQHPVRAGTVVARPPATGVAHSLTAGDDGLTYLLYGTRVAGDSVYFPDRGRVRLAGLGVTLEVGGPAGAA